MKTKLLMLLLAMLSTVSVFAQTISGEKSPCPGVPYVYEITLPTKNGIPYVTQLDNGYQSANMTSSQSGTNVTYKFTITWYNYYQVVNGAPVQSSFILRDAFTPTINYPIQVTIKGLSDIQFSSVPAPACNYRGEVTVSVAAVANATKYVWTNNAGWGNNNAETSTPSIKFIVNNDLPAQIIVKAFNTNCGTTTKQNSTTVSRAAVTTTPVFNTNTSNVLCPGVSGSASVSGAEGTPVGYEWYALPTGYVTINDVATTATSPLTTTGTSVTLKYANTAGGDSKPVVLSARAVYSANCKSPEVTRQIATGLPVSDNFQINGSSLGNVTGRSSGVCQNDVIYLFPQNNYPNEKILAHEWEVVDGDYSSINGFNGPSMRVRMANDPTSTLRLRYRFTTDCGTSPWNTVYLYNVADCGNWRMAARSESFTVSKTAAQAEFSVSPNPASSVINVVMPTTDKQQGTARLNITNMKGDVVISRRQAAASKFTIDVSSLPAGNYVVQIDAGVRKYTKQVVIVK